MQQRERNETKAQREGKKKERKGEKKTMRMKKTMATDGKIQMNEQRKKDKK